MCWICAERRASSVSLALLVIVLAACGGDPGSPEQRIRLLVAQAVEAIEDGSVQRAARFLHPGYSDRRHRDKAAATHSLFAYLRRHRDIHLFHLIKDIRLGPAGESASAVVYVAMTGVPVASVQALVALKADLYRFDLALLAADGEWLISGADWRRADLGQL